MEQSNLQGSENSNLHRFEDVFKPIPLQLRIQKISLKYEDLLLEIIETYIESFRTVTIESIILSNAKKLVEIEKLSYSTTDNLVSQLKSSNRCKKQLFSQLG